MYFHEHVVKSSIDMTLKVIRQYDWLLDLYVLDFFVDDHWNKLPLTWQNVFQNMDPQTLGMIISGNQTNIMLPLSFLTLIKVIKSLSLPRTPLYVCKSTQNSDNSNDSCVAHAKLKNLFLKHVKLKKRHEISLMSEIVLHTARQTQCEGVLDFGSGLGHLVRMLAYKHGLYAAGIECQTQLTTEARKLDLELEYTAKKHLTEEQVSKLHQPLHLNITLSSTNQLSQLSLPETLHNYGLIGLHPCGDLGPLLLKHFVNCNQVKFICVVGCCYMKLSSGGVDAGYPMSDYVKVLDSKLSYVAREISCHAIEVYCERLMKGEYEDLKIHAFRAALERILVAYNLKLKHAPVRSIKHSNGLTFQSYCAQALERLNIPLALEGGTWAQSEEDTQQWRRVVTVYTLRLALAPLVETLVLLDRVLYVLQHGLSCEIHPVFDPTLSPRNHIIIAKRK